MLSALTQILLFQLAGEVITRGLGLSVPGPVLGLVLFLGYLAMRRGPSPELQHTGQTLLQHLSLLFVPAGTGILLHLHTLEKEWVPIMVALLVSTFLAMGVTALTIQILTRKKAKQVEEQP